MNGALGVASLVPRLLYTVVVSAPKPEILVETAARLLEAAGGSMLITTLNKALFYLDLHALREAGAPITGTTYLALPAGPVVAKYQKRLIAALEDAGLAEQDISDDDASKPVCLVSAPGTAHLDATQLAMVARIGRWAAQKTATELSDISHWNDGWKLAWESGLGAKKPARPINLRIAMQQILDVDPWVDVPPDSEVADAFAGADAENGVEF